MRVCLIFAPFSSFSYIPLGISYLKGFVEKNLPAVRVKNIDLSNNFYHNLADRGFLDRLPELCDLCRYRNKPGCRGILRDKEFDSWIRIAMLVKAFMINAKEFSDDNKYKKLNSLHDSFYLKIIRCIMCVLKDHLENIPAGNNAAALENILFKDDINKISALKAGIAGFSVFSNPQLYYSLALAKAIKSRLGIKIIFGGAYIPHLDTREILKHFKFIDFIIVKEGELGLTGILKNLRNGKFADVPNLVYRKGLRIVQNKESAPLNLDNIPFPDFSDYDVGGYFTPRPVLSTLISRGCFWGACSFCAHHKTYSPPYRIRSAENLARELKHYQKRSIRHICFSDEAVPAGCLERICRALLRNKINMFFQIMLRPSGDFTDKVLKTMYKAGFRVIIWGVESFNQRTLDLMRKGTRAGEIERVLKTSYEAGLYNEVYMIKGFPAQTEGEMLEDMRMINKNARYIHSLGVHPFWLEADTYIFRNPREFGLKVYGRDYLLRGNKIKLSSDSIPFNRKENIDWEKINGLNTRLYKREGLFYSLEHLLLRASNKT
ncbi:MAG: radical SAM protein [Candidatus Omnitrophica bacterium]|nr:radical SAM protein [Candidatus Omnitrophota bacterium]